MIVTTGRIIKVDALLRFRFERSSETPGLCTVTSKDGELLKLPANKNDRDAFIQAYIRATEEEIGYRKQECE